MTNIEELKKKQKTLKSATAVLIGFVIVMSFVSVFLTIKKGIGFFTFLPLFFLSIILINYSNIKKLTKEIELKKNEN
jgi:hypothetical protein